MFGLFGKKDSPLEKLEKEYKKLMQEAFELSTSNRMKSDETYAKAQEVAGQIAALMEQENRQKDN